MSAPINTPGNDSGIPSHIGAGLCAIFPLLGGVIFYFIEKKDSFIRHWAVESIIFGGLWVGLYIVVQFLAIFFHAIHLGVLAVLLGLLYFLASLVLLVLWILGIVYAFQGRTWVYPVVSVYGHRWFPNLR